MRYPLLAGPVLNGALLVGLVLGVTTGVNAQPPTRDAGLALTYSFERLADATVSGGVPKDGIPAVDNPQFQTAAQADDLLKPEDVVFGAVINGKAKAYPRRIVVWHEIVNDRLGGENISVTYCPLTGTAIGFKRGDTTFGVSGDLVNSNLIMYDRETDSRWPQMLGTAVSGPLTGRSLERFRIVWTSWKQWQQQHPDTLVLSRQTGYARDYFRDPYNSSYNPPSGYYAEGGPTFPTLNKDSRLGPKEIVTGARTADGAVAFRSSAVRTSRMATKKSGETVLTAFYDPDLDTVHVYQNPEQRDFDHTAGRYSDGEDAWPAGRIPLQQVHTYDAMWFAWAAFFPETGLVE